MLIFLLPPSLEALETRLRGRGTDSDEEIALRMKNAIAEMGVAIEYDYVVVNDEIEPAPAGCSRSFTPRRAGRSAVW